MSDYFNEIAKTWDVKPARIERARKVAQAIQKELPAAGTMHALEFGSGTGLLGINLINHFKSMTFCDTSKNMLLEVSQKLTKYAIQHAETFHFDFTRENTQKKFDCIFSLLALHHVKDLSNLVKNFAASITKNGYLCLSDLDEEDGSFHSSGSEIDIHHHGINRARLIKICRDFGFDLVSETTPYRIKKEVNSQLKEFPLFLIIVRKH